MPPENWEKLNEIFQEAFCLKDAEREEFLRRTCPDEKFYADVKSLLDSSETAESFLDESAVSIGAKFLTKTGEQRFLGTRIGAHQIISEISHGGMGTVYLASRIDDEYQQRVAVKIIRRGMDTPALIERFKSERQFLAALNHSNVARMFDGGTTSDGLPYLVMEYVKGLPITEFCVRRNLSITERLHLFQKVCRAVSYAHKQGIIHRDIKPSNILVDENGEPKLLDFGIAKVWSEENDYSKTATELRIFTPEYASPEQIRGEKLNPSSDIYSLGVLLYEILTKQKPFEFENRSPLEIAQIVCESEPEKPSTAIFRSRRTVEETSLEYHESKIYETSRLLRGDLDNIILMALRKEPLRRYERAEDFCDDIERYLKNQPVKARPNNFLYRTKKFALRNRAVMSASAMILIAAIAFSAFSFYGANPTLRRDGARRLTNNDAADTIPRWADGGKRITFSREFDAGRMKAYEMNSDGTNQQPFSQKLNSDRLIYSPDNTKYVYRDDTNNRLYVHDLTTGKTTQITKYRAGRPAWSPDSQKLSFTYNFSQSLESNETPFYRPHDNTEVFVVNADGTNERNLTNNDEFDTDSSWSPDGKKIVFTSNRDGNFEIYSMNADGTNQTRLTNNLWDEHLAAWSPDGNKIVFASNRDGHDSLYLMNPDGSNQMRLTNSLGSDVEPAWSPDGKQIAFASEYDGNWEIYAISVSQ